MNSTVSCALRGMLPTLGLMGCSPPELSVDLTDAKVLDIATPDSADAGVSDSRQLDASRPDSARTELGALTDAAITDSVRMDSVAIDVGLRDSAAADLRADLGADLGRDVTVSDPCPAVAGAGARYGTLSVVGSPTDRPAAVHGDINLRLRSWASVPRVTRGLIMIDGPTDERAPRLNAMFTDDRIPVFSGVYAVQSWDWGCNCAREAIASPEVTLAGFATLPGEVIESPTSGYDIGEGYFGMVLYAGADTVTLKVTREDNVVRGYTIHVAGLCIDPGLLSAYEAANRAGRRSLPAVRGNQIIGRARGTEVQVAVRDTGSWMDPRSRKDWWPH